MIRFVLITLAAFCAMEGVSYLAHRFVYHRLLWVFHRSHHRRRTGLFEWNDVFPLFFSTTCIILMYVAVQDPTSMDLLALSVGIALYGTVYFAIHDLYVHRRAEWFAPRLPYLQKVKKAHMVHHLYGGEPYGLLLFPLPRELREREVRGDEVPDAEVRP
jgi:beta-carotene 3-hydroxylase